MPMAYFKVPLTVRQEGAREAALVPPKVLAGLNYRFVVVKDGGEEAIVRVDEPSSALAKVEKDKRCTRLTRKQLDTVRSGYPPPKLKERYRPQPSAEATAGAGAAVGVFELDNRGAAIVDVVQTVRSGLYLIDVPVVTSS